jgi:hypothetical protein
MPTQLEFAASHRYDSAKDGIEVPIALVSGNLSVEFVAKVDTGAAHCVFDRRYAEILGLNVESGRLQRFQTVTGVFTAYEHEVTLQMLGIEFPVLVYFAHDEGFRRNLLGRIGWLDRLRIAIIDYERTLHLSTYDA